MCCTVRGKLLGLVLLPGLERKYLPWSQGKQCQASLPKFSYDASLATAKSATFQLAYLVHHAWHIGHVGVHEGH